MMNMNHKKNTTYNRNGYRNYSCAGNGSSAGGQCSRILIDYNILHDLGQCKNQQFGLRTLHLLQSP